MYTTPTLIQSTCSSGNATTWHPNQIHLPIFNTLHFILSVGGEEVPCNLTKVVYDTFGTKKNVLFQMYQKQNTFVSTSRETIISFYKSA
jgi:hypothetical protein